MDIGGKFLVVRCPSTPTSWDWEETLESEQIELLKFLCIENCFWQSNVSLEMIAWLFSDCFKIFAIVIEMSR